MIALRWRRPASSRMGRNPGKGRRGRRQTLTMQAAANRQTPELDGQAYRSIMTSGTRQPILPVVAKEVTAWLASKGIRANVAETLDLRLDDVQVSAEHLAGETQRSLHVRLVESQ